MNDMTTATSALCHFQVRNHSTTKHFRFKWPTTHANLKFSPAVAHLLAGSSKDVTLTFSADVPVRLAPAEIKMSLVQISHAVGACLCRATLSYSSSLKWRKERQWRQWAAMAVSIVVLVVLLSWAGPETIEPALRAKLVCLSIQGTAEVNHTSHQA